MLFIVFVHGLILVVFGAALGVIGALYPETRGHFLLAGVLCGFVGALLATVTREGHGQLQRRHTFLLTATVWITAATAGAFPLWLWGLTATDAFFEAMSGITTTGSTVMVGLDDTPRGILIWRAILQWLGGVGFVVAGIALLPILRVGGMQLFRSESSERGERELYSAARFATATLWVYAGLTALCGAVYYAGGMTAFEAVAHALTTLSTGGYSTSDASFGQFDSAFLHWSGTIFMLAGALPFAWYIRLVQRRIARSEQVPVLLAGLAVSILALSLWRVATSDATPFQALTDTAFSVVSVVTTTGYATVDYTTWGAFAVMAFFLLTAVGGCTGSTSGGVKAMRWIVLVRAIRSRALMVQTPHRIAPILYEHKAVTDDQLNGIIAFFTVFILTFTGLSVGLAMMGLDDLTAISGALTALTNVGPGVGPIIGPAGNFSTLPDDAKWLLAFGMYVGRLEMMTVYVLFLPAFWRD